MLLAYCVVAAIVVGYLRGGRLKNYLNAPLRFVLLPCLAFMVEASFSRLSAIPGFPPSQWLKLAVGEEYLLLAAFICFNFQYPGVKLLGLATAANFAAMSANQFRMPVSPLIYRYPGLSEFVTRIQSGDLPEYILVDWESPLWFLGDTLPLFNGLASVGDLLMAAALFILILHMMTAQPPKPQPIFS